MLNIHFVVCKLSPMCCRFRENFLHTLKSCCVSQDITGESSLSLTNRKSSLRLTNRKISLSLTNRTTPKVSGQDGTGESKLSLNTTSTPASPGQDRTGDRSPNHHYITTQHNRSISSASGRHKRRQRSLEDNNLVIVRGEGQRTHSLHNPPDWKEPGQETTEQGHIRLHSRLTSNGTGQERKGQRPHSLHNPPAMKEPGQETLEQRHLSLLNRSSSHGVGQARTGQTDLSLHNQSFPPPARQDRPGQNRLSLHNQSTFIKPKKARTAHSLPNWSTSTASRHAIERQGSIISLQNRSYAKPAGQERAEQRSINLKKRPSAGPAGHDKAGQRSPSRKNRKVCGSLLSPSVMV